MSLSGIWIEKPKSPKPKPSKEKTSLSSLLNTYYQRALSKSGILVFYRQDQKRTILKKLEKV